MNEKELRRMSRASLLEVILLQGKENQQLQEANDRLTQALENKQIAIGESGSMAEACLRLNHMFEDADAAVAQYRENMAQRSGEPAGEEAPVQAPTEAQQETERLLADAREQAARIVAEADERAEVKLKQAETLADSILREAEEKQNEASRLLEAAQTAVRQVQEEVRRAEQQIRAFLKDRAELEPGAGT